MDPLEVQTKPKKSRRLLWVAIAVVIALVVAGTVYALVTNMTQPEVATTTPSPSSSPEASVATNDEVKQNLASADAAIKQAAEDQAAAKAALKDNEQQIKVGN